MLERSITVRVNVDLEWFRKGKILDPSEVHCTDATDAGELALWSFCTRTSPAVETRKGPNGSHRELATFGHGNALCSQFLQAISFWLKPCTSCASGLWLPWAQIHQAQAMASTTSTQRPARTKFAQPSKSPHGHFKVLLLQVIASRAMQSAIACRNIVPGW